MVGTPCLVLGSGQTADAPRACAVPGILPGAAEGWGVEGCRAAGWEAGCCRAAGWDAGRTTGGGVGDRSRDVELPDVGADVGGGPAPRSKEVEPAGDDL